MIARLAIAPQAIVDLGAEMPQRQAKINHEVFLRAIRAHGSLVFASNDEASTLLEVLNRGDGLPPGAGQKWKALLTEFLKQPRRAEVLKPPQAFVFAGMHELEDLRSTWAGRAEVAILDCAQGEALGIPEDEGSLILGPDGFEVVTAPSAAWCHHLERFQELMKRGFAPQGSSRDTFWAEILQPLARASMSVTVVDKYLFKAVMSGRRVANPEHVTWLLNHLDGSLRERSSVTLVGQRRESETADEVLESILRMWNRSDDARISLLKVALVPKMSGVAGRREPIMPHDRHIRFDVGGAVVIPAGFDRMCGPNILDQDGMKWIYNWDSAAVNSLRIAEQRCLQAHGIDVAS